jgi:hypothetical protein
MSKKCALHLFLPGQLKNSKIPLYLEESVTVHYFRKFKFYDARNIFSILKLYYEILKLSPSLVHLPGGIPFGLPIIYPLIKLRFPLIITAHEPTPYSISLYDSLLLRIHITMADAVIVAGKVIEKEMVRYWASKKLNIFTVPFGAYIHYTKLIKSAIEENKNTVLFWQDSPS